MSETEEDRAYYAAGEAAFVARRGTPFLLSPRDFALLKEWRAIGVPIEAVEAGIDEAFGRREERGSTGRVNSLSYCRDAVLTAWERRAETAVGRGAAGDEARAADVGPTLERLAERLEAIARARPELTQKVESALRSLERLAKSRKEPGEVEASLARLDRRLCNELSEALDPEARERIEKKVNDVLARARVVTMDRETEEKTRRALTRRHLRAELDLPRLTLVGD